MSRIDTSRLPSSTPSARRGSDFASNVPADRLARVLERGGDRTRDAASRDLPNFLLQEPGLAPFVGVAPNESVLNFQDRALPSVGTVVEADLAPLSGLSGDQLLSELSRIGIDLREKRAGETDPDACQSYDVGLAMIEESVRRLRLMHSGQDSLIL